MKAVINYQLLRYNLFLSDFLSAAWVKNIYLVRFLNHNVTLQPKQISPIKQVFSFKFCLQRTQHKKYECSHYFSFFSFFLSPRCFHFFFSFSSVIFGLIGGKKSCRRFLFCFSQSNGCNFPLVRFQNSSKIIFWLLLPIR